MTFSIHFHSLRLLRTLLFVSECVKWEGRSLNSAHARTFLTLVILIANNIYTYMHTYVWYEYYHKHIQYHFHLLHKVIDLLSATRMNIISIVDVCATIWLWPWPHLVMPVWLLTQFAWYNTELQACWLWFRALEKWNKADYCINFVVVWHLLHIKTGSRERLFK